MFTLNTKKPKHHWAPVTVITSSFISVILIGSLLLMLPISSVDRIGIGFIDALFTATSATCVTGLTVFDTYSQFSLFGQIVIISLIQIGGIGVVSFATFFALTIKGKLGLRNLKLAGEYANFGNTIGIQQLLKTIIIITLICEGVGAFVLGLRFVPLYGIDGVFMSIFLSISAYCNAGFDIFGFIEPGTSLAAFTGDYLVLGAVSFLIVLGGIGFVVFQDLITFFRNGRKKYHLMLHSKVVITMTILLIGIGSILFFTIEYSHSLSGLNMGEKILNSIFSAITPRTAGFSSISFDSTQEITRMLTSGLMFIGASPGSTGGGVKTTTLLILIMTVVSVIRGREETVVFNKEVSKNIVYKAMALFTLASFLVAIVGLTMFLIEPQYSLNSLFFEAISAFSTTGLSVVGTSGLSSVSRILLIILMILGRIGPITFAITLTMRKGSKKNGATLPEGRIMVG